MRIYSVNNTNQYPKTSFHSWTREICDPRKGVINRNNTCFFRGRIIKELAELISYEFKNLPKANIYCFGCSDGSEPLSLVMAMLSLEENLDSEKFFPIIARDVDPIAIEKAKKNDHKMTKDEKDIIDIYTNDQYYRFVKEPYGEPWNLNDGTPVVIKKEVLDKVDFAVGDILKDYKEINPKNSMVIARNFWPYIEKKERDKFFKNLYEHLDAGSFVAVGDFDQKGIAHKLEGNLNLELLRLGFKPTFVRYVYSK